MAVKRVTSSKRDREKAKQSKREEKQKRIEEMLAYVDENGILHSTPEGVKPKEEIDASEIEISIPKKGEAEEILPLNGRIEHFNVSRGYGFIKDLGSGEKYFFHITSAPEGITEGDNVTFEIERGTRGMNAVRISIINK